MNISSSSQYNFSNIANLSSANSASQLRVGQTQIENRGSVIQPVDESAAIAVINKNRSQITLTDNNQNTSNKQSSFADNEISQQAQDESLQTAQSEELDRLQVQDLAARDREVRNHERAHAAVGGLYAGSPTYTFERGPDGINYAVGGEVSISLGAISGDPEATIQKAQVVRRAALAPTEPSAQDRSVAARAVQIESQARVELRNSEAQERIVERESAEARIENRQVSDVNDASTPTSRSINSNSQQDITAANTDSRVQRLSDELNLRVSRADPFGVSKPGQIFSQFI